MKTVIKIVIALLVVTASFNAGRAALNNYQFQDAVHEGLLFDVRASDDQITDMVMKVASEYDIPINEEDIHIRDAGRDVEVTMAYTTNVAFVPGVFARDWTFTPSASVRILTGSRRQ